MFDFKKEFQQHINNLINLKSRILELEAFNEEWSKVFEYLEKQTGEQSKIIVNHALLFNTYIYDKYHVLVSDIKSLIGSQLTGQNTVIKNAHQFLKIHELEFYLDESRVANLSPTSEEHNPWGPKEIAAFHAERSREACLQALQKLYPGATAETVTEESMKALRDRVSELSFRIQSTRDFYNHKYEDFARRKSAEKGEILDLKDVRKIHEDYCEIISDIALIFNQTSYSFDASFYYERSAQDAIDIIIFGSINAALRAYEPERSEHYGLEYWKARNDFFNSEKILRILSKK